MSEYLETSSEEFGLVIYSSVSTEAQMEAQIGKICGYLFRSPDLAYIFPYFPENKQNELMFRIERFVRDIYGMYILTNPIHTGYISAFGTYCYSHEDFVYFSQNDIPGAFEELILDLSGKVLKKYRMNKYTTLNNRRYNTKTQIDNIL